MTCGIYKITSPSGNCYVGQSVNIEKRWMAHRYSVKKERHNRAFTNAVKKYGIDSFVFEILEECSVDELTDREQFWMDKLKPKYCIRVAADSNFGLVHSEETKRKMSEANRGKTPSEETKRKIGEANKGRILSEEHKMKLREAMSGEKHHGFGKALSEKTKRKIGEASRGRTHSKEAKQKMSEANRGKIL
jgi:group I intron endonuclease|nr:MAG TPA: intron associated endonuclease [Caudoviricetes sp.]